MDWFVFWELRTLTSTISCFEPIGSFRLPEVWVFSRLNRHWVVSIFCFLVLLKNNTISHSLAGRVLRCQVNLGLARIVHILGVTERRSVLLHQCLVVHFALQA